MEESTTVTSTSSAKIATLLIHPEHVQKPFIFDEAGWEKYWTTYNNQIVSTSQNSSLDEIKTHAHKITCQQLGISDKKTKALIEAHQFCIQEKYPGDEYKEKFQTYLKNLSTLEHTVNETIGIVKKLKDFKNIMPLNTLDEDTSHNELRKRFNNNLLKVGMVFDDISEETENKIPENADISEASRLIYHVTKYLDVVALTLKNQDTYKSLMEICVHHTELSQDPQYKDEIAFSERQVSQKREPGQRDSMNNIMTQSFQFITATRLIIPELIKLNTRVNNDPAINEYIDTVKGRIDEFLKNADTHTTNLQILYTLADTKSPRTNMAIQKLEPELYNLISMPNYTEAKKRAIITKINTLIKTLLEDAPDMTDSLSAKENNLQKEIILKNLRCLIHFARIAKNDSTYVPEAISSEAASKIMSLSNGFNPEEKLTPAWTALEKSFKPKLSMIQKTVNFFSFPFRKNTEKESNLGTFAKLKNWFNHNPSQNIPVSIPTLVELAVKPSSILTKLSGMMYGLFNKPKPSPKNQNTETEPDVKLETRLSSAPTLK